MRFRRERSAPARASGPHVVACALPSEMGLTPVDGGAEAAIFSRNGETVFVCLFDEAGEREIARLPLPSRTGDIHHGFLPGAGAGLRYGLRVEGPWAPERGHRFDSAKLLVDPHARRIDRPYQWRAELAAPPQAGLDTARSVPKAIVAPPPPRIDQSKERPPSFIYEAPARGFSMRLPGVAPEKAGTLAALAHDRALDHLARLGVSHLELLPIAAWMDERHLPALGLSNAWGYNPVGFLAIDPRLAPEGPSTLAALAARYREAGIGIILDVVFNHTAESDLFGGTVSLRGLDNAVYYRHARDDPGDLVNDTGCGNTLALDRAPVLRLAMDALRFWRRLGVAGFRFDLATVLGRGEDGYSPEAPLLSAMLQDPELRDCVLIAEPWDLGPGGYRLGEFPAPFGEWNGRFRDDVRRFWRGDADMAGALATRLAGSADLFQATRRGPSASVNYVASHDGFTLRDLVSYALRHNEANGEQNRDGTTENFSWNNGAEGETDDPAIRAARERDMRALLMTLFLSRGTPMILAGDEAGRTQHGNNNAYAQAGEDFQLDWAGMDESLVAFVAALSAFRRAQARFFPDAFLAGRAAEEEGEPDARWLRPDGAAMEDGDWADADAFGLLLADGEARLLILINRARAEASFALPSTPGDWTEALRSCGEPPARFEISGSFTIPGRCVCALTAAASG